MNFDGKKLVIDNSSLELVTTCPRKAYNALMLRRRLAVDAPALRFGAFIHHALAYRYKMEAFGKRWLQDKQLRILERLFINTPCEMESWRNLAMAQKVIIHYNEEFGLDATEVVRLPNYYNLPLVEKPFLLFAGNVDGVDVWYSGRIDLGIKRNNALYVLDFKTTSMMGESFWNDASCMEAQRGYIWGVTQALGEEPTGYVIRALAIRPPTKTGTSIEFKEQTFYTKVPPGQIEEWRLNMLEQCRLFLWHHSRNAWPMYHKHCVGKFATCEYFNVCSLPAASREGLLQSDAFRTNDWSPLYH